MLEMAGQAMPKALSQNACVNSNPPLLKKKRSLPGTPDPDAEAIALSPKTLMATNRFLCEICGKGFQRDQNLQLHRRGHNLPWKLRQRSNKESRKRVYICPEKSCVHHHPSRALGDLTGIKKHFCRKHGEKKWKCDKCSKRYAVQSDWKAHSKTCGTREYRCDCGTLFSRRDSFITHRAFCDALAEETARLTAGSDINNGLATGNINCHFLESTLRPNMMQHFSSIFRPISNNNEAMDQVRASLSLLIGQGPQGDEIINNNLSEMHRIEPLNPATSSADLFASCSNPQTTDYQSNWVYGRKLSSTNSGELTSTSLQTGSKKEISASSLFSTQHQNYPPTSTNMSATALLQKAAQIGVTSTDPSLLGSLGVKFDDARIRAGHKYSGLLGPNTIAPNCVTNLENSINDTSLSNQFHLYSGNSGKSQKDDQGGGQTRDFLGVGFPSLCPSSIQGWI